MSKLDQEDTLRLSERQREAVRELVDLYLRFKTLPHFAECGYMGGINHVIQELMDLINKVEALEEKLGLNGDGDE